MTTRQLSENDEQLLLFFTELAESKYTGNLARFGYIYTDEFREKVKAIVNLARRADLVQEVIPAEETSK